MDIVSVVIPIYKVEPYLCRCLDSVIEQTYQNLEVILVDDGSPDGCSAICDEYAMCDARIKVIHKQNGGLSDARNAGMSVASGEYLMFVDSDDWLEKNAIELLYQLLKENNAQIAIGGMQRVEDGTNEIIKSDNLDNSDKKVNCMTSIQAMVDVFHNGCAAWGRLYCRKIHEGILFPVGEINEDEAIVLQLLERCNTIVQTNEVIYNYRYRQESITTSSFSEKKLAWYRHCKQNLRWIKKHHPELEADAIKRFCSSILYFAQEIAVIDKRYRVYVYPMLHELRINYKGCRKQDWTIAERLRLWSLRYLSYDTFCSIQRGLYFIHEKN